MVEPSQRQLAYAIRRYGHGHRETFVAGCDCAPCKKAFRSVEEFRTSASRFSYYHDPEAERQKSVSHGTRSCYVHGCRRPECKEANNLYVRLHRTKQAVFA